MQTTNLVDEKTTISRVAPTNDRIISRPVLNRIIIGVILLMILIQFGFFKTYLMHFPGFEVYTARHGGTKYNFTMHFHGMMMMGWMWMLLLQPILILKGKVKWHQLVGKASYVLAPVAIFTMYLANQDQFHSLAAAQGEREAIAAIAATFPEGVFFAVLYALAIYYRHQPQLHMRLMCSTLFMFINPAQARFLRTFFDLPGFAISTVVTLILVGVVALVDSRRTKRISVFWLPFAMLSIHLILSLVRNTDFWQSVGGVIAKIF